MGVGKVGTLIDNGAQKESEGIIKVCGVNIWNETSNMIVPVESRGTSPVDVYDYQNRNLSEMGTSLANFFMWVPTPEDM